MNNQLTQAAQCATQQNEIPAAMDGLAVALRALEEQIEILITAIAPVLKPDKAVETRETGVCDASTCSLAQHVAGRTDTARNLCCLVKDTINRVAL